MPVRPLTPELAEKARVELFEDPKKLEEGIQMLKDWISKQPHLRVRTDDQWLAAFLRGTKHSVERAKEKIDLYYTLKTIAPELHPLKHSDAKFKEILKMGHILPLPKTANPADPRVILVRAGLEPPGKYKPEEVMSIGAIIQRIMYIEDDNFIVAGGISIMDFQTASMGHFTQFSPLLMKKLVIAGQDAAPVRMKGVHYLHLPSGVETIFNIGKSFLNEKNRNRLHVHGKNIENLYKHVPKDILPVEYGGDGGTLQEIIDYWVKKVEEYADFLDEDLKHGTDEKLRPGKARSAQDMFGVEGSFRQLEFD
ncbi:hypothetical protein O0L34_g1123 [Tuta absoluta]|nr:hypothetical protein O0L34_g1123 [Tuta absoluta]